MKKKILNVLKFVGFLSLGLGIIGWVWYNLSPAQKEKTIYDLTHANYFWIALSITLGVLSHVSRALRWRLIFEPMGYAPRRVNLFFSVMSMYFFNMLVTRLGEAARCAVLQQYEKIPFEKSFGTVVAERAVDFLMLLILLGLTVVLQLDYINEMWDGLIHADSGGGPKKEPSFFMKNLKFFILGFIALVVAVLYLLRKHPFFGKIFNKVKTMGRGFWQGIIAVGKIKKRGQFLAHTLFIWAMYYSMTYVAFFALPATSHMSWLAPLSVLIFGSFAIMFIPNGTGAFQLITQAILSIAAFGSLDRGTAFSLGNLIWIAQTALILIVGGLCVALMPVYNRKKNEQPELH